MVFLALHNLTFARISVALLGFGLSTLSGLVPLLTHELQSGKNIFIFLTCFCGGFCLIFSFSMNQSQNQMNFFPSTPSPSPTSTSSPSSSSSPAVSFSPEILIPIGTIFMAIGQVILKNIPSQSNIVQKSFQRVPVDEEGGGHNNDNEDEIDDDDSDDGNGEIELMLPKSSSPSPSPSAVGPSTHHDNITILSLEEKRAHKNRLTINKNEVSFLCFTTLLALFILSVYHGIQYSSRQHVGYGKLIASILYLCLMSITQGVLVLRTVLLSDQYILFILILSSGYPLGIMIGLWFQTIQSLQFNTIIMRIITSTTSLSHGVLLYIALMALAGSEVRARGKSHLKITGIVSGTIVAMILVFVNLYL